MHRVGKARTVYKAAQESRLKPTGVTRGLPGRVGRAKVGWMQLWLYSWTLYLYLSPSSSHVRPALCPFGARCPGL